MTSGGLGTMGYGLPAASACRSPTPRRWSSTSRAKPRADEHAGNLAPRCSTALPVKIFILNNEYMGMVRQWQELLHGEPLFAELLRGAARLREAGRGLRRQGLALRDPDNLDDAIKEMIELKHDGPVICFDCCWVDKKAKVSEELLPDDPLVVGAAVAQTRWAL
jgi:acetolactate synthase-1/2/3 large subunit